MSEGELILGVGLLLAASVAAALVASRLRLPALVLFLGVGAVGGRWIGFDDYDTAQRAGMVALALILFEGGLGSSFATLGAVRRPALLLALPATVVTALVTGVAAAGLFGLPLVAGLLTGSIVASTDGTAVFVLLRGTALEPRLAHVLEAETGLNDPVAVLMVTGFIAWLQRPGYGVADMAWLLARELALGAACGLAIGRVGAGVFTRLRVPHSGLFAVASLALAALAYGTADVLHGSGLLAVYLAGVALGGAPIPGRQTVAVFYEGVAWVAQVGLFALLGLLLHPGRLGQWLGPSIGLAIVLLLLARPLAVFGVTVAERLTAGERVVLAWAGLRGAGPIVFATFPVLAGVEHAERVYSVVFYVVALSTLVQGTTFTTLARGLGVTTDAPELPRPLTEHGMRRALGGEVIEHPVATGDAIVGRRIDELALPAFAHVALVVRGREAIPPPASWRVAAGDVLHLIARDEVVGEVLAATETWRRGPSALVVTSWTPEHGDPADPPAVLGVAIGERLMARGDRAGALLKLADGRVAVTGPVIAAGPADELARYARRRTLTAADRAERDWWRAVAVRLERATPTRRPGSARSARRRLWRPSG